MCHVLYVTCYVSLFTVKKNMEEKKKKNYEEKKEEEKYLEEEKLDGVGPVDNRPSTN